MFEDFKTVDIVLNKADENILTQESFILNSGDYNGRKLRVQITNDGIIEDTSGISLNFGFWRYDLDEKGVFPFEVVDYTKGLYEINYPSEMLQEKEGMAVCQIQMIDIQGSIVNSYDFKVNIIRSLFTEEFVVAENSPTVLQKALIDISRNTTEILIIEATLAEILSQYNNLYNYFEENVATVSQWQEIKENVDQINLNTSLVAENNEILKDNMFHLWEVFNYRDSSSSSGGYSWNNSPKITGGNNLNICDVSGKGYLVSLFFRPQGALVDLKITADDKIFLFRIDAKADMKVRSLRGPIAFSGSMDTYPLVSSTTRRYSGNEYFVPDGIFFKNNLKIEIETLTSESGETSSQVAINYQILMGE